MSLPFNTPHCARATITQSGLVSHTRAAAVLPPDCLYQLFAERGWGLQVLEQFVTQVAYLDIGEDEVCVVCRMEVTHFSE